MSSPSLERRNSASSLPDQHPAKLPQSQSNPNIGVGELRDGISQSQADVHEGSSGFCASCAAIGHTIANAFWAFIRFITCGRFGQQNEEVVVESEDPSDVSEVEHSNHEDKIEHSNHEDKIEHSDHEDKIEHSDHEDEVEHSDHEDEVVNPPHVDQSHFSSEYAYALGEDGDLEEGDFQSPSGYEFSLEEDDHQEHYDLEELSMHDSEDESDDDLPLEDESDDDLPLFAYAEEHSPSPSSTSPAFIPSSSSSSSPPPTPQPESFVQRKLKMSPTPPPVSDAPKLPGVDQARAAVMGAATAIAATLKLDGIPQELKIQIKTADSTEAGVELHWAVIKWIIPYFSDEITEQYATLIKNVKALRDAIEANEKPPEEELVFSNSNKETDDEITETMNSPQISSMDMFSLSSKPRKRMSSSLSSSSFGELPDTLPSGQPREKKEWTVDELAAIAATERRKSQLSLNPLAPRASTPPAFSSFMPQPGEGNSLHRRSLSRDSASSFSSFPFTPASVHPLHSSHSSSSSESPAVSTPRPSPQSPKPVSEARRDKEEQKEKEEVIQHGSPSPSISPIATPTPRQSPKPVSEARREKEEQKEKEDSVERSSTPPPVVPAASMLPETKKMVLQVADGVSEDGRVIYKPLNGTHEDKLRKQLLGKQKYDSIQDYNEAVALLDQHIAVHGCVPILESEKEPLNGVVQFILSLRKVGDLGYMKASELTEVFFGKGALEIVTDIVLGRDTEYLSKSPFITSQPAPWLHALNQLKDKQQLFRKFSMLMRNPAALLKEFNSIALGLYPVEKLAACITPSTVQKALASLLGSVELAQLEIYIHAPENRKLFPNPNQTCAQVQAIMLSLQQVPSIAAGNEQLAEQVDKLRQTLDQQKRVTLPQLQLATEGQKTFIFSSTPEQKAVKAMEATIKEQEAQLAKLAKPLQNHLENAFLPQAGIHVVALAGLLLGLPEEEITVAAPQTKKLFEDLPGPAPQ